MSERSASDIVDKWRDWDYNPLISLEDMETLLDSGGEFSWLNKPSHSSRTEDPEQYHLQIVKFEGRKYYSVTREKVDYCRGKFVTD